MKHEDSYFINPGSATGAYSTTTPDAQPSFVLMDIDGSRVRWACAQMHSMQSCHFCGHCFGELECMH